MSSVAMAPAMAAVSASAAGALMAAAAPGASGPLTVPRPMAVPEHTKASKLSA